ncbi:MAG: hypothetical protein IPO39_18885 [Bacteroidetes bacterium]|nr:hypothetical protein [Bacteroidota bacterium]
MEEIWKSLRFFFILAYQSIDTLAGDIRGRFQSLFESSESVQPEPTGLSIIQTYIKSAEGRLLFGTELSKEFNFDWYKLTVWEYFIHVEEYQRRAEKAKAQAKEWQQKTS